MGKRVKRRVPIPINFSTSEIGAVRVAINKKKIMTRAVSLLTMGFFLVSQLAFANPGAGIEIAVNREIPSSLRIDIPSELATLDGLYEAPLQQDPKLILHIQNAHANYGAQQKIKELLQYLEKHYAMKTIFVEGASEDLNPDYLKMFPDRERNMKLAEFLAKQGELTGAEMYLLEADNPGLGTRDSSLEKMRDPNKSRGTSYVSRADDRKVKAHGIEDAGLYRENYDALKKVFGSEVTVKRYLEGFEGRLSTLASKVFSKDLLKLLEEWKKFEKGHREFIPYVKGLATESKRVLGVDLESLLSQIEWPQITRLLVLQTMEKELDMQKGLAERDLLIQFLKEKKASVKLITAIENFRDQQVTVLQGTRGGAAAPVQPRDLMEQLVTEAGPKGFYFYNYPHFSLYAGYLILKSEMDPKGLFGEIRVLFTRILDQLAGSQREKKLLALYRNEEMVRKLLNLELTRKDWQEVLAKKDLLAMDPLVAELKEIGTAVSRESGLPLSNFETKPVNSKFRGEVMEVQTAAYGFYEAARKREDVFYEKIDSVMRKESLNKAVLITGGFHTDGITELLREHEISYGTLTPRLSEKSDENLYRNVMLMNRSYPFEISNLEAISALQRWVTQQGQAGDMTITRQRLRSYTRALMQLQVENAPKNLDEAIGIINAYLKNLTAKGENNTLDHLEKVDANHYRIVLRHEAQAVEAIKKVGATTSEITDVLDKIANSTAPAQQVSPILAQALAEQGGRMDRIIATREAKAAGPVIAEKQIAPIVNQVATSVGQEPASVAAAILNDMNKLSTKTPVDGMAFNVVEVQRSEVREEEQPPKGKPGEVESVQKVDKIPVWLPGNPSDSVETRQNQLVEEVMRAGSVSAYVRSKEADRGQIAQQIAQINYYLRRHPEIRDRIDRGPSWMPGDAATMSLAQRQKLLIADLLKAGSVLAYEEGAGLSKGRVSGYFSSHPEVKQAYDKLKFPDWFPGKPGEDPETRTRKFLIALAKAGSVPRLEKKLDITIHLIHDYLQNHPDLEQEARDVLVPSWFPGKAGQIAEERGAMLVREIARRGGSTAFAKAHDLKPTAVMAYLKYHPELRSETDLLLNLVQGIPNRGNLLQFFAEPKLIEDWVQQFKTAQEEMKTPRNLRDVSLIRLSACQWIFEEPERGRLALAYDRLIARRLWGDDNSLKTADMRRQVQELRERDAEAILERLDGVSTVSLPDLWTALEGRLRTAESINDLRWLVNFTLTEKGARFLWTDHGMTLVADTREPYQKPYDAEKQSEAKWDWLTTKLHRWAEAVSGIIKEFDEKFTTQYLGRNSEQRLEEMHREAEQLQGQGLLGTITIREIRSADELLREVESILIRFTPVQRHVNAISYNSTKKKLEPLLEKLSKFDKDTRRLEETRSKRKATGDVNVDVLARNLALSVSFQQSVADYSVMHRASYRASVQGALQAYEIKGLQERTPDLLRRIQTALEKTTLESRVQKRLAEMNLSSVQSGEKKQRSEVRENFFKETPDSFLEMVSKLPSIPEEAQQSLNEVLKDRGLFAQQVERKGLAMSKIEQHLARLVELLESTAAISPSATFENTASKEIFRIDAEKPELTLLSTDDAKKFLEHTRYFHLEHISQFPFTFLDLGQKVYFRDIKTSLNGESLNITQALVVSESKMAQAEITEFFLVNGVYVGYGVTRYMGPTDVELQFNLFPQVPGSRFGRGLIPGLSKAIYQMRMETLRRMLDDGAVLTVEESQFLSAGTLGFYLSLGFEPWSKDPSLKLPKGTISPREFKKLKPQLKGGLKYIFPLAKSKEGEQPETRSEVREVAGVGADGVSKIRRLMETKLPLHPRLKVEWETAGSKRKPQQAADQAADPISVSSVALVANEITKRFGLDVTSGLVMNKQGDFGTSEGPASWVVVPSTILSYQTSYQTLANIFYNKVSAGGILVVAYPEGEVPAISDSVRGSPKEQAETGVESFSAGLLKDHDIHYVIIQKSGPSSAKAPEGNRSEARENDRAVDEASKTEVPLAEIPSDSRFPDEVIRQVVDSIYEAIPDKGGIVAVDGMSGAGKSTMARQIIEEYRRRGLPVLFFPNVENDELQQGVLGADAFFESDIIRYAIRKLIFGESLTGQEIKALTESPFRDWLNADLAGKVFTDESKFLHRKEALVTLLNRIRQFIDSENQKTAQLSTGPIYDKRNKQILPNGTTLRLQRGKKALGIFDNKYSLLPEFEPFVDFSIRIEIPSNLSNSQMVSRLRDLGYSGSQIERSLKAFNQIFLPSWESYAQMTAHKPRLIVQKNERSKLWVVSVAAKSEARSETRQVLNETDIIKAMNIAAVLESRALDPEAPETLALVNEALRARKMTATLEDLRQAAAMSQQLPAVKNMIAEANKKSPAERIEILSKIYENPDQQLTFGAAVLMSGTQASNDRKVDIQEVRRLHREKGTDFENKRQEIEEIFKLQDASLQALLLTNAYQGNPSLYAAVFNERGAYLTPEQSEKNTNALIRKMIDQAHAEFVNKFSLKDPEDINKARLFIEDLFARFETQAHEWVSRFSDTHTLDTAAFRAVLLSGAVMGRIARGIHSSISDVLKSGTNDLCTSLSSSIKSYGDLILEFNPERMDQLDAETNARGDGQAWYYPDDLPWGLIKDPRTPVVRPSDKFSDTMNRQDAKRYMSAAIAADFVKSFTDSLPTDVASALKIDEQQIETFIMLHTGLARAPGGMLGKPEGHWPVAISVLDNVIVARAPRSKEAQINQFFEEAIQQAKDDQETIAKLKALQSKIIFYEGITGESERARQYVNRTKGTDPIGNYLSHKKIAGQISVSLEAIIVNVEGVNMKTLQNFLSQLYPDTEWDLHGKVLIPTNKKFLEFNNNPELSAAFANQIEFAVSYLLVGKIALEALLSTQPKFHKNGKPATYVPDEAVFNLLGIDAKASPVRDDPYAALVEQLFKPREALSGLSFLEFLMPGIALNPKIRQVFDQTNHWITDPDVKTPSLALLRLAILLAGTPLADATVIGQTALSKPRDQQVLRRLLQADSEFAKACQLQSVDSVEKTKQLVGFLSAEYEKEIGEAFDTKSFNKALLKKLKELGYSEELMGEFQVKMRKEKGPLLESDILTVLQTEKKSNIFKLDHVADFVTLFAPYNEYARRLMDQGPQAVSMGTLVTPGVPRGPPQKIPSKPFIDKLVAASSGPVFSENESKDSHIRRLMAQRTRLSESLLSPYRKLLESREMISPDTADNIQTLLLSLNRIDQQIRFRLAVVSGRAAEGYEWGQNNVEDLIPLIDPGQPAILAGFNARGLDTRSQVVVVDAGEGGKVYRYEYLDGRVIYVVNPYASGALYATSTELILECLKLQEFSGFDLSKSPFVINSRNADVAVARFVLQNAEAIKEKKNAESLLLAAKSEDFLNTTQMSTQDSIKTGSGWLNSFDLNKMDPETRERYLKARAFYFAINGMLMGPVALKDFNEVVNTIGSMENAYREDTADFQGSDIQKYFERTNDLVKKGRAVIKESASPPKVYGKVVVFKNLKSKVHPIPVTDELTERELQDPSLAGTVVVVKSQLGGLVGHNIVVAFRPDRASSFKGLSLVESLEKFKVLESLRRFERKIDAWTGATEMWTAGMISGRAVDPAILSLLKELKTILSVDFSVEDPKAALDSIKDKLYLAVFQKKIDQEQLKSIELELTKILKEVSANNWGGAPYRTFGSPFVTRGGSTAISVEEVARIVDADIQQQLAGLAEFEKALKDLKSKDRDTRVHAVSQLAKYRGKTSFDFWQPLMKDQSGLVRQEVAITLGLLGFKKSIPDLLAFLKDSDPHVQWLAAVSLSQFHDEDRIAPVLLEMLTQWKKVTRKQGEAERARKSFLLAAQAQVKQGYGSLEAVFLEAYQNCQDPVIRSIAVAQLGYMNSMSSFISLQRILNIDPDPAIRDAVIEAIFNHKGPRAYEILKTYRDLNKETDPYVRIHLADRCQNLSGEGKQLSLAFHADDPILKDRFLGAWVGGGLGDAMGAGVEGYLPDDFVQAFGKEVIDGYVEPFASRNEGFQRGQFTDDTETKVAIAQTLIGQQNFDPHQIAKSLGRLVGEIDMRQRIDTGYGINTLNVGRALNVGVDWRLSGRPGTSSGSAMRAAVIGMVNIYRPDLILEQAKVQSRITHVQTSAQASSIAVALAVQRVLMMTEEEKRSLIADPSSKEEFVRHIALDIAKVDIDFSDKLEELIPLLNGNRDALTSKFGRGGAIGVVALALYYFLKTPDSFETTILGSINHGGDTDTIASISGTLSGAFNGLAAVKSYQAEKAIPLLGHEILEETAAGLYELSRKWNPENGKATNGLRSEVRTKLESAALQNDPEKLITLVEAIPYIKESALFNKAIDVREENYEPGYNLRTHTLRVLRQFEHYFTSADLPAGVSLPLMRLLLVLHDIGKPIAVAQKSKADQHTYTKQVMEAIKEHLPVSEREFDLLISLMNGDPLGLYIRNKKSLNETAELIESRSLALGMQASDYLKVLTILLQADVSSYTRDAGGVYPVDKPGMDYVFKKDAAGKFLKNSALGRLVFNKKSEAKLQELEKTIRPINGKGLSSEIRSEMRTKNEFEEINDYATSAGEFLIKVIRYDWMSFVLGAPIILFGAVAGAVLQDFPSVIQNGINIGAQSVMAFGALQFLRPFFDFLHEMGHAGVLKFYGKKEIEYRITDEAISVVQGMELSERKAFYFSIAGFAAAGIPALILASTSILMWGVNSFGFLFGVMLFISQGIGSRGDMEAAFWEWRHSSRGSPMLGGQLKAFLDALNPGERIRIEYRDYSQRSLPLKKQQHAFMDGEFVSYELLREVPVKQFLIHIKNDEGEQKLTYTSDNYSHYQIMGIQRINTAAIEKGSARSEVRRGEEILAAKQALRNVAMEFSLMALGVSPWRVSGEKLRILMLPLWTYVTQWVLMGLSYGSTFGWVEGVSLSIYSFYLFLFHFSQASGRLGRVFLENEQVMLETGELSAQRSEMRGDEGKGRLKIILNWNDPRSPLPRLKRWLLFGIPAIAVIIGTLAVYTYFRGLPISKIFHPSARVVTQVKVPVLTVFDQEALTGNLEALRMNMEKIQDEKMQRIVRHYLDTIEFLRDSEKTLYPQASDKECAERIQHLAFAAVYLTYLENPTFEPYQKKKGPAAGPFQIEAQTAVDLFREAMNAPEGSPVRQLIEKNWTPGVATFYKALKSTKYNTLKKEEMRTVRESIASDATLQHLLWRLFIYIRMEPSAKEVAGRPGEKDGWPQFHGRYNTPFLADTAKPRNEGEEAELHYGLATRLKATAVKSFMAQLVEKTMRESLSASNRQQTETLFKNLLVDLYQVENINAPLTNALRRIRDAESLADKIDAEMGKPAAERNLAKLQGYRKRITVNLRNLNNIKLKNKYLADARRALEALNQYSPKGYQPGNWESIQKEANDGVLNSAEATERLIVTLNGQARKLDPLLAGASKARKAATTKGRGRSEMRILSRTAVTSRLIGTTVAVTGIVGYFNLLVLGAFFRQGEIPSLLNTQGYLAIGVTLPLTIYFVFLIVHELGHWLTARLLHVPVRLVPSTMGPGAEWSRTEAGPWKSAWIQQGGAFGYIVAAILSPVIGLFLQRGNFGQDLLGLNLALTSMIGLMGFFGNLCLGSTSRDGRPKVLVLRDAILDRINFQSQDQKGGRLFAFRPTAGQRLLDLAGIAQGGQRSEVRKETETQGKIDEIGEQLRKLETIPGTKSIVNVPSGEQAQEATNLIALATATNGRVVTTRQVESDAFKTEDSWKPMWEGELYQKQLLQKFQKVNDLKNFIFCIGDLDKMGALNLAFSKDIVGVLGMPNSTDLLFLPKESPYFEFRNEFMKILEAQGVRVYRGVGGDEFVIVADHPFDLENVIKEFTIAFQGRYSLLKVTKILTAAEILFLKENPYVISAANYGTSTHILVDRRKLNTEEKWGNFIEKIQTGLDLKEGQFFERRFETKEDGSGAKDRGFFSATGVTVSADIVLNYLSDVMKDQGGRNYWTEKDPATGEESLRFERIELFRVWGMRLANDALTAAKETGFTIDKKTGLMIAKDGTGRNQAVNVPSYEGENRKIFIKKEVTPEKILAEEKNIENIVYPKQSPLENRDALTGFYNLTGGRDAANKAGDIEEVDEITFTSYGVQGQSQVKGRVFHEANSLIGYTGGNNLIEADSRVVCSIYGIKADKTFNAMNEKGVIISRDPPDTFITAKRKRPENIRGPPQTSQLTTGRLDELAREMQIPINGEAVGLHTSEPPTITALVIKKDSLDQLQTMDGLHIQFIPLFKAKDIMSLVGWFLSAIKSVSPEDLEKVVDVEWGKHSRILTFNPSKADALLALYRLAQDRKAEESFLKELGGRDVSLFRELAAKKPVSRSEMREGVLTEVGTKDEAYSESLAGHLQAIMPSARSEMREDADQIANREINDFVKKVVSMGVVQDTNTIDTFIYETLQKVPVSFQRERHNLRDLREDLSRMAFVIREIQKPEFELRVEQFLGLGTDGWAFRVSDADRKSFAVKVDVPRDDVMPADEIEKNHTDTMKITNQSVNFAHRFGIWPLTHKLTSADGSKKTETLIMGVNEFVEGENFRNISSLLHFSRTDLVKLLNVAKQYVVIHQFLDSKGLIHADPKNLSNIIVGSKGTAKLVDFGHLYTTETLLERLRREKIKPLPPRSVLSDEEALPGVMEANAQLFFQALRPIFAGAQFRVVRDSIEYRVLGALIEKIPDPVNGVLPAVVPWQELLEAITAAEAGLRKAEGPENGQRSEVREAEDQGRARVVAEARNILNDRAGKLETFGRSLERGDANQPEKSAADRMPSERMVDAGEPATSGEKQRFESRVLEPVPPELDRKNVMLVHGVGFYSDPLNHAKGVVEAAKDEESAQSTTYVARGHQQELRTGIGFSFSPSDPNVVKYAANMSDLGNPVSAAEQGINLSYKEIHDAILAHDSQEGRIPMNEVAIRFHGVGAIDGVWYQVTRYPQPNPAESERVDALRQFQAAVLISLLRSAGVPCPNKVTRIETDGQWTEISLDTQKIIRGFNASPYGKLLKTPVSSLEEIKAALIRKGILSEGQEFFADASSRPTDISGANQRSEVRITSAEAVWRVIAPEHQKIVNETRLGLDPGALRSSEALEGLPLEFKASVVAALVAGKILRAEMTAEQLASVLVSIAKVSEKQVVDWIANVRKIIGNLFLKTETAEVGKERFVTVEVIHAEDKIGVGDLGVLVNKNLAKGIIIMADGKDPKALAAAKEQAKAMNKLAKQLLKDLGGAPERFKAVVVNSSSRIAVKNALNKLVQELARRQEGFVLMGDAADLRVFPPTEVNSRVIMIDRAYHAATAERIAASIMAARVSEKLLGIAPAEIEKAIEDMLNRTERGGFYTFNATIFGQMLVVAIQALQAIQSAA